jgi:broad specificity phosphatase PhoE
VSDELEFPPGKVFYVMRHAETVDNEKGQVSGSASVTTLTDKGKEQASSMQQVLSRLAPPVGRIVTSEMQRAKDTAELACNSGLLKNLPRNVDAGINERNYGDGEGMSDKERKAFMAGGGKINGEEDKQSQALRVTAAIKRNLGEDGVPLFITHGGNMLRMMEVAFGGTKASAEAVRKNVSRPANCSLYEFVTPGEKGGKWQLNEITLDQNQEIQRRPVNVDISKADTVTAEKRKPLDMLGWAL